MRGFLLGYVLATAMAIGGAPSAAAAPVNAPMLEGGYALAPFSFAKFCLDYPAECPKSPGAARVHLTPARMADLAAVNRAVNAAIEPTPDTSEFRFWRLNVSAGDCNSFAVQKRHELIKRGWPAGALALSVVKTSWGEGHLVVAVRTDQGDFVLDNLRANIVPWQRAGYRWIMRQSEKNPQYWAELNGGRAAPVYAMASLDDAAPADQAAAPSAEADRAVAAKAGVEAAKALIADAERWIDQRQDLLAAAYALAAAALDPLVGERAVVADANAPTPTAKDSVAEVARWVDEGRQAVEPIWRDATALAHALIAPQGGPAIDAAAAAVNPAPVGML